MTVQGKFLHWDEFSNFDSEVYELIIFPRGEGVFLHLASKS